MSHSKLFLLLLPLLMIGAASHAETQRPLYTLENKFPRWGQFESGFTYDSVNREDDSFQPDLQVFSPYLRYGLMENLAVRVDVPLVNADPAIGGSETGLGDVEIELQLRTWQDIFDYPYFIPHVSVTLPTGDEDKGLGKEDATVEAGIAYGDKLVIDELNWVLDVSYRVDPDQDNTLIVGHSYIWDVSEKFALLTEILYEEDIEGDADSLVLLSGGFSYNWTEDLQMGVHAGGGLSGDTESTAQVRFSYSF